MATSMRPRTGTPIQTLGAVGRVQARTLRNTTQPATLPRSAVQLQMAGASRKRAAALRPSTAEEAAGKPGRQALAAQKAGRWRWLGRPQVNQMARMQRTTTLVSSAALKGPTVRRSGE